MNKEKIISKPDKIILFLLEEHNNGSKVKIEFEDIVVGVYKKYPSDFHLKGYPEYPDSGEIHKPLYKFRKKGYIEGSSKVFSLTQRGIEYATSMIQKQNDSDNAIDSTRLSRSSITELNRVKGLEGFQLFLKGNKEKIIENDLYNYFNITVQTPSHRCEGRFNAMKDLINDINKHKDIPLFINNQLYQQITNYHNFLIQEYNDLINYSMKSKK